VLLPYCTVSYTLSGLQTAAPSTIFELLLFLRKPFAWHLQELCTLLVSVLMEEKVS